jgi:hypothetical protein
LIVSMNGLLQRTRAAKKKKLVRWGVRQLLSACITIPVVIKWPHLWWLVPIWIALAALSLSVFLMMFKKLENRMQKLDSAIGRISADGDPIDRGDVRD